MWTCELLIAAALFSAVAEFLVYHRHFDRSFVTLACDFSRSTSPNIQNNSGKRQLLTFQRWGTQSQSSKLKPPYWWKYWNRNRSAVTPSICTKFGVLTNITCMPTGNTFGVNVARTKIKMSTCCNVENSFLFVTRIVVPCDVMWVCVCRFRLNRSKPTM